MDIPAWHMEMQRITRDAGGLTPNVNEFYFLRHGETALNKARIIQTQRGVTLNDTGREQARNAAKILVGIEFGEIFASDLERAWETASIVNDVCKKPIHKVEKLHERNWGEMAGQSNVDLNWLANPAGGESLTEFTLRTLDGLRDVLQHGKNLIVAHGGNYAVLLAALGLSVSGPRVVTNGTPMRLRRNGGAAADWLAESISA